MIRVQCNFRIYIKKRVLSGQLTCIQANLDYRSSGLPLTRIMLGQAFVSEKCMTMTMILKISYINDKKCQCCIYCGLDVLGCCSIYLLLVTVYQSASS